ncbi:hypothetical protein ACU8OR_30040 (plasmid) [Rhizobium leguminosarum]
MTPSTPLLHILPNGVHHREDDGRTTLRLLLLLLPDRPHTTSPSEADEPTQWPLDDWPSRAHAWLDELGATGRVVTLLDARNDAVIAVGKIRSASQPLGLRDLRRIEMLWDRAVGGGPAFTDLLHEAVTSTPQGKTAAAIPAPTLEASLLLPLERARAALEAVGGPNAPLAGRPPARPRMRALAAIGRPWLGTAEPMVQLAATGADVLTPELARRLTSPPDVAAWLAQRAVGVDDLTHPYARPLNPEALAVAALGRGDEDLLWLSDRLHALHHASLNLPAADDPDLPAETTAGGRQLHQLLASPAMMRLFGWARDVLLDLPSLPACDETAIRCVLAPSAGDPVSRSVAAVLDTAMDGFFPAVKADWLRLTGKGSAAPWARTGLRELSPEAGPRVFAGSIEPSLSTESDHQCQLNNRATRLVTGPLSLFPLRDAKPDESGSDETVIFATALAAPPRLHLGIDGWDGTTTWYPTSVRTVALSDPWLAGEDAVWPEAMLSSLTPNWLPAWERDAASVTDNTTYQGRRADGELLCKTRDSRLAAYHGEDLGAPPNELTLAEAKGRPIGWQTDDVKLDPRYDLLVSQRISVASEADLAPLFFGWSYRFSLAERTLGGGGAGLEHVQRAMAQGGNTLAWPPSGQPGFRFLRHEPIAKLVVLLASDTPRDGGLEHKLQTSERMVLVRAKAPRADDARSLSRTSRILLVPAVACAAAARHDVFDDEAERTAIRVQDADQRWVEVPVRIPPQGLRDSFIEGDPTVPGRAGVKQPVRFRARRPGEPREIRQSPYYPDPAAALLVIRLAHPADGSWLDEPPLVLRLRPPIESRGPDAWPDVAPVRIDLVAAKNTAERRLSDSGWDKGPASAGLRSRVVTVTLAPGEAVTFKAWLVPDAADLAAWFDVIERSAVLAQAEANACTDPSAGATLDGLAALIGNRACADGSAVDRAAASFQAHMLAEPLSEIADTLELDLVHASDAPILAPAFVPGTVGLARPTALEPAALARFLGESGPAASWGQGAAAEDGAVTLVPGGTIVFDQATTDQLVIEAEMVAPGRESLDRQPRVLPPQLSPLPPQQLPFRLTSDGQAHFGWPDDPDALPGPVGLAPLQPRRVELLRITNIPLPANARAGQRELSLEELFAGASAGFAGASVAFQPALEQPQARRVRLYVRALPRHASLITGAPKKTVPLNTDRSLVGPPTGMLWAPATARPAPVVPKDFGPDLEWPPLIRRQDQSGLTIEGERRVGLRLWLRRPWFSSGEDERLGIVLWPPPAFRFSNGSTAAFALDDEALHGLHPGDLGPLGAFVSSWGYDPLGTEPPAPSVQSLSTPRQPDRSASAFLARSHIDLGSNSRFHPNLLMPVPGLVDAESLVKRETMASVSVISAPVRFAHELPAPPDEGPDAYVDLTMHLPTPSDALFQLGLVRLQEHARLDDRASPGSDARPGIKLSAPTPLQGQVPPVRRFGVTVTPIDKRHGVGRTVSLVGLTLAGPVAADGRGQTGRRVSMRLSEMLGGDEVSVTDEDGKDADLLWVAGESRQGVEHRALGDEEHWTAVFRIPGNILREKRNIVASIAEEGWLSDSAGGPPSIPVPRFAVSVPLLEK